MARELTDEERALAIGMMERARAAQAQIVDWSQKDLDRLSQAIAWYAGNEKTFTRLAEQGVDESGIGDRAGRPGKRFKIHMVLRDVLRTPSTGIVEIDEERGLAKYAKPAGVIATYSNDKPSHDTPCNRRVFGQRQKCGNFFTAPADGPNHI